MIAFFLSSIPVLYFFLFYGFMCQAYGMSESTGPHSINNITKGFHLNSAGKGLPGCITKISNPDKDGNGEVGIIIISFYISSLISI